MTWVIAYVVATHAMLSTEKGNTPDNTDLLATAFANRMTQTILEKLS